MNGPLVQRSINPNDYEMVPESKAKRYRLKDDHTYDISQRSFAYLRRNAEPANEKERGHKPTLPSLKHNQTKAQSDTAYLESRSQKLLEIGLGGIGYDKTDRLRAFNQDTVGDIAQSFAEIGQLQPIVVTPCRTPTTGGYKIVAGVHRYEAAKKLKWEKIKAVLIEGDADTLLLAEVSENLIRGELTAVERALHTAKAKEVYERLHPETTEGNMKSRYVKDRHAANRGDLQITSTIPSFVRKMASETGVTPSTVHAITRQGRIKGVKKAIGTSIDTDNDLRALARIETKDPELAASIIDRAASGEKISATTELKKLQGVIKTTPAAELAEWIIEHAEPPEFPKLASLLADCRARDVADILRAELKRRKAEAAP